MSEKSKKNARTIIIKIICFMFFTICSISYVSNITIRTDSKQKMHDFFEQKEPFDVLFVGSSHVMNGILPIDLWKKYGIISYNIANPAETITQSYYNILLAVQEKKPKLIVLDTYFMFKEKIIQKEKVHYTLDAYPISYTKHMAIKNLIDEGNTLQNEIEFQFPFSIYHSNWKNITANNFKKSGSFVKGARTTVGILDEFDIIEYDSVDSFNDDETINMQYLKKIIEYCKENDIEILLTYLPMISREYDIGISKYIYKISNQYKVKYVNLSKNAIVNYDIDMFDKNHLNTSGARKITDYIGNYIISNFNIKNQKNNEKFEFWNDNYDEYIDFKIKTLKKEKNNINNFLMLLYDECDIRYEIKIKDDFIVDKDSMLFKLLNNLNNNYSYTNTEFKDKDKKIQIKIFDNRNNKALDTIYF